ncbi:protein of unknown function [Streptomyces murinus]
MSVAARTVEAWIFVWPGCEGCSRDRGGWWPPRPPSWCSRAPVPGRRPPPADPSPCTAPTG